ncbi:MAG: YraN family protein [Bacillota bacterium]|nr:YraN family protein [Bacillota bacterium]
MNRQGKGRWAEEWAARYLAEQGWEILHRNYRCRCGEIDLIAVEGGVLVFVEVRGRTSDVCGLPEESLTLPKRRRLMAAAAFYLSRAAGKAGAGEGQREYRFDVLTLLHQKGRVVSFQHYRNALGAGGVVV